MKPLLLTKNTVCAMIGRTRSGLDKLIARDETFPRPIKMGKHKQSPTCFDAGELHTWIEVQKQHRGN